MNELSYKNELGLIQKLLKISFRWDQARFCGSICLGAALNWINMVRDDKYYTDVSRSPESICCPNFVRLVFFRCYYASPSVRPSMFLFVRKRRKHSTGNIRETNFIFNTLSGINQRLSGHFRHPTWPGGGQMDWQKNQGTKLQPIIVMDKLVFDILLDYFLPS